jgi:hypothetical protein
MNELALRNEVVVIERKTVEGEIIFNDKPVPTIYDVAKIAGVSIATVSRVVNGTDRVRPKTAQKVNYAIWQLNWTPNPDAVQTALCK